MIPRTREVARKDVAFWFALCAAAAVLVTCMGSAGCAHGRGWRSRDTAAQASFAALLAVDGYQTYTFVLPNGIEANPVIGERGQRVPAGPYLAGVLALELVAAWALPPHWRSLLEGVVLGAEGASVWTNYALEYL